MTGAVAIAVQELRAQRAVLAVAACALVLVLLVPLSPAISADDAATAISVGSLLLGLWVPAVIALFLGSVMLARELGEGRLGFWLTRPVGAWSLWLGKVGAAILLLLSCQLIILLPAIMLPPLGRSKTFVVVGVPAEQGPLLLLPFLLLLAAHVAGVAFRSRTRWLFLDLAGVVAVAWLARAALAPLLRLAPFAGAYDLGFAGLWLVAAILLVGFAAAVVVSGGIQVSRGRSDVRRSHRALALAVWPAATVVAVVALGVSSWARSTPPGGLAPATDLGVGPGARWLDVVGVGRLRTPARYLVDTAGDRRIRLPLRAASSTSLTFAAEAPVAAWTVPVEGIPGFARVVAADLQTLEVADSGFGLTERVSELALSPDGRRLAVLADGVLTVLDLVTNERTSARVQASLVLGLFLEESVRLYQATAIGMPETRVEILEMNPGGLGPVGSFVAEYPLRVFPAPDLDRLVVAGPDGEWVVVDARTGEVLETVVDDRIAAARLLGDGRPAVVRLVHGEATVAVGDDLSLALGRAREVVLAGELDGFVVVALWRRSSGEHPSQWDAVAVDLETGELREIGRGIVPIPWDLAFGTRIGHVAPRLFIDSDGRLFRWLPDEDRLVPALPG